MDPACRAKHAEAIALFTANAKRVEQLIKVITAVPAPTQVIDSPDLAVDYWMQYVACANWFDREREACIALLLNTKYAVIGFSLVGLGTLNECIVHPRDVFRAAIAANAYAVLLMHNHPSGDARPSNKDIELTERCREVADLVMLEFLDHVIVANASSYFSFKEGARL